MTTAAHKCVEETTSSNITVKEKGKRANFKNPARDNFLRVHFDGCLVEQETAADWIVSKRGKCSVVIELKGKDVEHACDQLFKTISNPLSKPLLEEKIALLIICSRYPSFDTKVAKAMNEARKKGMRLKVCCNQVDCHIDDLFSK